jgi:hypothetical protein
MGGKPSFQAFNIRKYAEELIFDRTLISTGNTDLEMDPG